MPCKAGGIEIAGRAHRLQIEDGLDARPGRAADLTIWRWTVTSAPPASASVITRPFEAPLAGKFQPHDMRQGGRDIGIGDGRGIGEAGFEIRSDGGHEIAGFGAAEAAMVALAGGERRVHAPPPCIAAQFRSPVEKERKLT